jgi:hypothetical protein
MQIARGNNFTAGQFATREPGILDGCLVNASRRDPNGVPKAADIRGGDGLVNTSLTGEQIYFHGRLRLRQTLCWKRLPP